MLIVSGRFSVLAVVLQVAKVSGQDENYRLWSRFRCRSTWKNFENLRVNGPPTRLMSESLSYIVANVISWMCSKLARCPFLIICHFDLVDLKNKVG